MDVPRLRLSPDLTVQEPCIIRAEPKLSGMVLL